MNTVIVVIVDVLTYEEASLLIGSEFNSVFVIKNESFDNKCLTSIEKSHRFILDLVVKKGDILRFLEGWFTIKKRRI